MSRITTGFVIIFGWVSIKNLCKEIFKTLQSNESTCDIIYYELVKAKVSVLSIDDFLLDL